MKVSEFLEKYDIFLRYAQDRNLLKRNPDCEVLAYAVSFAGKFTGSWDSSCSHYNENYSKYRLKAYSVGFIVKTQKAFVGFINGTRKDVAQVFEWIKHFSSEKEIQNEENLKKELVLHNL